MQAKTLLITGGAGFIGVNSARHFLRQGWGVTVFDNFSRKGTEVTIAMLQKDHPEVRVIRGDICRDIDLLSKAVSAHDAVLHLAGQVAVTSSILDPRHDIEQNMLGTFNVLEAIRLSPNKPPIIYASTNKVYGELEHHPVRERLMRYEFVDDAYRTFGVPESQPLSFHSPYGCSKGAADQYVMDYARIYGLRTLVFRQSCIYGPNQFGVEDQGWLAWFAIAAMLHKPLTLYGTGKQVRDALFVDDLSKLYELGFSQIERLSGKAYNVGGGPDNTLSLQELLYFLGSEFNYTLKPGHAPTRAGDQPVFVADIRALEKDFGWKPATSLEQGIIAMHSWLLTNKEQVAAVLAPTEAKVTTFTKSNIL
jgi:CDP-paratose 2-epimerase